MYSSVHCYGSRRCNRVLQGDLDYPEFAVLLRVSCRRKCVAVKVSVQPYLTQTGDDGRRSMYVCPPQNWVGLWCEPNASLECLDGLRAPWRSAPFASGP